MTHMQQTHVNLFPQASLQLAVFRGSWQCGSVSPVLMHSLYLQSLRVQMPETAADTRH